MMLYLATEAGFLAAERTDAGFSLVRHILTDHDLTSIIAREGAILAGTTDGIFLSEDGGTSWTPRSNGLTHRHVRWLAFHPNVSDFELAGTEPAAIFVSKNGGEMWLGRDEVEALRDRLGWWLPYSPEAGCVRGFAVSAQMPNRLFAAVEVGGLLRSDDSAETWTHIAGDDHRPQGLHPDVHSVALHPTSAERVFAPTGGGFYVSEDSGLTWENRYEDGYVRAVWVDSAEGNHLLLGPASGPSGDNGRIEESHDGGRSWQPLTERQSDNMVERFHQIHDELFAVMSSGQLWHTRLDALNWRHVLPDAPPIRAIASPL